MTGTIIVLALLGVVLVYVVIYNGLASALTRVQEGWSGIEVQLKRRHDLVPNLVAAVKKATSHEDAIFERILTARTQAVAAMAGSDREKVAEAEASLGSSMRGLLAYVEDNPEITATANIATFQKQIEETEDQIAAARRLYNGNVQSLNARIAMFPGNLVAAAHRFRPSKPFEMTEAERAVTYERPDVKL